MKVGEEGRGGGGGGGTIASSEGLQICGRCHLRKPKIHGN